MFAVLRALARLRYPESDAVVVLSKNAIPFSHRQEITDSYDMELCTRCEKLLQKLGL